MNDESADRISGGADGIGNAWRGPLWHRQQLDAGGRCRVGLGLFGVATDARNVRRTASVIVQSL